MRPLRARPHSITSESLTESFTILLHEEPSWRTLQGEAVAIKPNGTLVRTFTMQAVYAVPSKTVVSHLKGRAIKATGQSKVYGKTVFVLGNTKLILKQELRAAATLACEAAMDGVLVEVWKEGTRATQAQVRQFQVHQTR